jgi:hypothetical protein
MIRSDKASIFGDTYNGVPNPQVGHLHPYPTRYHGAIFTTPRFGLPFIANPYARGPYSGFSGTSGGVPVAPLLLGVVAVAGVGALAGAMSAGKDKATVGMRAGLAVGAFASLAYLYEASNVSKLDGVVNALSKVGSGK